MQLWSVGLLVGLVSGEAKEGFPPPTDTARLVVRKVGASPAPTVQGLSRRTLVLVSVSSGF